MREGSGDEEIGDEQGRESANQDVENLETEIEFLQDHWGFSVEPVSHFGGHPVNLLHASRHCTRRACLDSPPMPSHCAGNGLRVYRQCRRGGSNFI